MNTNPSDKFRTPKDDCSPYLSHFTSGSEDCALEKLVNIVIERKIKSKKSPYTCYTAAPISMMWDFFHTLVNRTQQPMYQPYGIAFARDILIKQYNARNVIYSPPAGIDQLSDQFKWRAVKLDVLLYDFEFLREWRVQGDCFDFKDFPQEHILIIVPDEDAEKKFVERYKSRTNKDCSFNIRRMDFIKDLKNDIALSGSTVNPPQCSGELGDFSMADAHVITQIH